VSLGMLAHDPMSPLGRRNPVAKLAAATALTLGLLVTLDPVAPAVALCVELAVVPLFGLRYPPLLRRAAPLLISAAGIAVVQLLFTTAPDRVAAAAGLALRIFAVAIPGIVIFATTDPTELADALVQQARVPVRFAMGALAALRLLPLLSADLQALTRARRARGIAAGRSPAAAVALFWSTLFALLVAAIRRGTHLATAMDARGFDAGHPRSFARTQRFGPADVALVAGGLAAAALALAVSLATGEFRPLL
jgi:energy-coupling factor transport system permease protein